MFHPKKSDRIFLDISPPVMPFDNVTNKSTFVVNVGGNILTLNHSATINAIFDTRAEQNDAIFGQNYKYNMKFKFIFCWKNTSHRV